MVLLVKDEVESSCGVAVRLYESELRYPHVGSGQWLPLLEADMIRANVSGTRTTVH